MLNRFDRTREDHARETAEDYVELILTLTEERGEARAVDIASRLAISHVTAAKTLRRLQRDGLVTSEPYRSIFLTEKGRAVAQEARRRHDIVLRFLIAAGVPEDAAHTDSEGMEHHASAATLEAMQRFIESK